MQFELNLSRLRRIAIYGWLIGAGLGLAGVGAIAADEAPKASTAATLDNATCLSCHDAKKSKIQVPDAQGKPRPLHAIPADKFGQSVHFTMQCVTCHTDIKDNAEKGNAHAKDTAQPLKKVD